MAAIVRENGTPIQSGYGLMKKRKAQDHAASGRRKGTRAAVKQTWRKDWA